ncbi:MAG: hypothetical protein JWO31_3795 [Phycisphaerales bacterium]|nr:hypothetical protein [Phycisphaerales bacterium]
MRRIGVRTVVVVGGALAAAAALPFSLAAAPATRPAAPATRPAAAQQVTLSKRLPQGGPYGTSAYSFRYRSQDKAVHKNYVDVLYSTCGLVHINQSAG